MDLAVLVKVVPRSESLRYDPATHRVRREGTELLVNPFDQRAVRVALELRRPGETVSVVSLGPPEARAPLAELRALGVDRVLLLSDPVFRGSDTLATARALVAGLGRVGHDVVLAGAWTTDSETGQVGAEVAALLGVPVLSEARAVRRDPEGVGFEVTVDTPVGAASYRVRAPCLLGVGEKIAKPLKVDPAALARLRETAVELVSAAALAIDSALVGVAGSPTVVGKVEEVAPHRAARCFGEGTVAERVRGALEALAPLLGRPRPAPLPWHEASPPLPEAAEVPVLVTGRDGDLDPYALGLLTEVRRALPGHWPSAVWVGAAPDEAGTYRLGRAGALGGYHVPIAESQPDSTVVASAVGAVLVLRPHAAAVLFLSDPFGREVAGAVAARRGLGLVGDVFAIAVDPLLGVVGHKASFGGHAVARIHSRTRPVLLTVRPGTFAPPDDGAEAGGFGWRTLPPERSKSRLVRLSETRESEPFAELERREVVAAVGMGVGGPEGVARVRALLGPLSAGLVATRRVVDAGWVPRQLQVGLTGHALAPCLGLLLGLSGSANHLVGWRRAPLLVAVNSDPAAPVFRAVDVGVVGPLEEVLPPLVEGLARLLAR